MQKKLLITLVSSLFFGLVGCSSPLTVTPYAEIQRGETELLKKQRKYVGEAIYTAYNYEESFSTRLSANGKIMGAKVNIQNADASRVDVLGKVAASVPAERATIISMGISQPAVGAVVLVDSDNDGLLDELHNSGYSGKVVPPVKVRWKSDRDNTYGMKRELIYQGLDGDTLRLNYREFIDDLARPAFSQTTEYNISESSTLQFRGVTVDVHQADNETITYTVLSGSLQSE
jgi:putative lipoic acid-binding regulatory protein